MLMKNRLNFIFYRICILESDIRVIYISNTFMFQGNIL